MSQENVEIVARSIDAFNRAFNRGDLEGFLEFVTPDIEWLPVMGAMDRDGSFRGRSGVEAYFAALRDAWEDLAFAPGNEVRDLGEKTLMVGRLQGRGRGSGVTVDTPIGPMLALASEAALCALEFSSPDRLPRLEARLDRWFALIPVNIADIDGAQGRCVRSGIY